MTVAPRPRRLRERLAFRLAFLLAVVLLPLTLISVARTNAMMEEARARSEAALMGETMRAAIGELRLIQEARGAATGLATAIGPLVDDAEKCAAILRELLVRDPQYSVIAYVAPDGVSRCNSADRILDFSGDPLYERALTKPRTSFAVKQTGLVSGASVLEITHPVFGEDGAYLGLISVSLPHAGLRVARDSLEGVIPLTMITFDSAGAVLTASRQMDDLGIAVPRERPLTSLVGERAFSFSGPASTGEDRVFSVVPLVPSELYALGSWPPEGAGNTRALFGFLPVLFPILMSIASLVVAWMAVEHLVIRHIRKLRRSLISFSGGSRIIGDIDVSGAPLEIRDMAESYARMTETILHDEAEMEDMVHQKEVLLREVHHRVKNNLQLIASIMNMQMRQTHSAEARSIMKGLQDRVMSLATIHRELYQTAGLSDVHSDELLTTIVRQITNLADRPDRRFEVHRDFDDIRMVPDQAVPLALLVAEALTNALKYAAGTPGGPAQLWISLKRLDESRAELHVKNTVGARAPDVQARGVDEPAHSGLGSQLVAAFAMQIGGTVERCEEDGLYALTVPFELRPLSDAEEGQEPAA